MTPASSTSGCRRSGALCPGDTSPATFKPTSRTWLNHTPPESPIVRCSPFGGHSFNKGIQGDTAESRIGCAHTPGSSGSVSLWCHHCGAPVPSGMHVVGLKSSRESSEPFLSPWTQGTWPWVPDTRVAPVPWLAPCGPCLNVCRTSNLLPPLASDSGPFSLLLVVRPLGLQEPGC